MIWGYHYFRKHPTPISRNVLTIWEIMSKRCGNFSSMAGINHSLRPFQGIRFGEISQGSLHGTHFWGESKLIQIYGHFEGFPVNNNALFGLVIKWPLFDEFRIAFLKKTDAHFGQWNLRSNFSLFFSSKTTRNVQLNVPLKVVVWYLYTLSFFQSPKSWPIHFDHQVSIHLIFFAHGLFLPPICFFWGWVKSS